MSYTSVIFILYGYNMIIILARRLLNEATNVHHHAAPCYTSVINHNELLNKKYAVMIPCILLRMIMNSFVINVQRIAVTLLEGKSSSRSVAL